MKIINRIYFKAFFRINFLLILVFLFCYCNLEDSKESEINSISISIKIDRFDKLFHKSDSKQIPDIKERYPFLFPAKFHDSVWINRQKDTLQLLLLNEVEKSFPKMDFLESEIKKLFQHIKFYFPSIKTPHVIGLINNVDYQNKIIYRDSLLIISLDTYLGDSNLLYEGIPKYIRQEMDEKYLTSHIAEKFADSKILSPMNKSFLTQMIFYGKKLYLKDILMPKKSDEIKIGYNENQINWAVENEKYIWEYILERKLLYKNDTSLKKRFIDPSPFSKFYLEIDNESPGKIGQWLGWQIVRSFSINNPEVQLSEILSMPAETLFKKSSYKPSR
ncbi:MAG: gliding motility lipoprotein GldB [Flavobacteriaceae bacterium]|nr:gliding motility lipoprotein GldB [Flavobacteriaceae bacterium]